jgi:hypothetical protein
MLARLRQGLLEPPIKDMLVALEQIHLHIQLAAVVALVGAVVMVQV